MVGFPKALNSKFDYEFIRENFPIEKWRPAFQDLLDERMQWFNMGKIDSPEKGITDKTHKVIENPASDDRPAEYYQYELREDPACKMFRLGFTADEVNEVLILIKDESIYD